MTSQGPPPPADVEVVKHAPLSELIERMRTKLAAGKPTATLKAHELEALVELAAMALAIRDGVR